MSAPNFWGGFCSKFLGGGVSAPIFFGGVGGWCLLQILGGGCLLQIFGGVGSGPGGEVPPIFGIRSPFGWYTSYWNAFLLLAMNPHFGCQNHLHGLYSLCYFVYIDLCPNNA